LLLSQKPDYGIDSPGIIIGQFVIAAALLLVAAFVPKILMVHIRWGALVVGLYFLYSGVNMIFYSKYGKLELREELLNSIPWRGDEAVLDVGCGRGLLTVGAARRLTSGNAVGVDLWEPKAITGNRPESVLENAAAEGVADRVTVKRGDARQLPFPDCSFDVILSNFVVHEVETAEERRQILKEMVRVLRPGGRVALIDFIFTGQCVADLRSYGFADARRDRMGKLGFWAGALLTFGAVQLYQVSATKPHTVAQPLTPPFASDEI